MTTKVIGEKYNTPYKGVYWDKTGWVARFSFNYSREYLGRYSTPEEAAKAYDKRAKEVHGERYPYLNHIKT